MWNVMWNKSDKLKIQTEPCNLFNFRNALKLLNFSTKNNFFTTSSELSIIKNDVNGISRLLFYDY